jgi:hypothetical protein
MPVEDVRYWAFADVGRSAAGYHSTTGSSVVPVSSLRDDSNPATTDHYRRRKVSLLCTLEAERQGRRT